MPSFDNYIQEVPQVVALEDAFASALEHAQRVKPVPAIEPALTKSDLAHFFSQLPIIFAEYSENATEEVKKVRQHLAIETVARRRFDTLLSTTPIDSPEFVNVWNMLDILIAMTEADQCDASLPFSLIEELIDSQTLEGCRTVFDYLESRREPLVKDWAHGKSLVILRTCNELLRRLSRAEDITFSGRVFIFMFQSFPMGDKGTVNLRGVYHTENVTTWEDIPSKPEDVTVETMEVDSKEDATEKSVSSGVKAVSFDGKNKPVTEKPVDTDALYPVFWSLQNYFSQPTKLFDAENMTKFKAGLEATVTAFESVAQGQRNSKTSDDTKDASKKRKRLEVDTSDSNNFNPKYLTSKDLFELEMSDLFFRRHILIQAIIVLDFLKSLTAKVKSKVTKVAVPNKSVMYQDKDISEEDGKWVDTMRNRIYEYIFAGPDGQYVHRIIQAVTQRDKGWSRWKLETCPPMERSAVTPDDFNEARASAKRMATNKRLRPHPMASLSLDFLKVEDEESSMEKFKDPARWRLPELAAFKNKIAEDDLELDFAKTEKEKAQIIEAKASKTWRALRIASRTRLAAFDRIENWDDINAVFEDPKNPSAEDLQEDDGQGEAGRKPEDGSPIVIAGPAGVGKSSLITMLQERQPRVFQKLIQHTNRQLHEGEVDGQDFHFVSAAAFNGMRDNDQFLELAERQEFATGTSANAAKLITDAGKIPILEMDQESVQSIKDWGYPARIVFISPSDIKQLETQLKSSSKHTEESIPNLLEVAQSEIDKSKEEPAFYDTVILNDDLQTALQDLEQFIYGSTAETNGIRGDSATKDGDVTMDMDESAAIANDDRELETAETNGT